MSDIDVSTIIFTILSKRDARYAGFGTSVDPVEAHTHSMISNHKTILKVNGLQYV